MTTKAKAKATKTKGATLEARIAQMLEAMIADGLKGIDQHIRRQLGGPMSAAQAESLADLCIELARMRTALLEGGSSPANENARAS